MFSKIVSVSVLSVLASTCAFGAITASEAEKLGTTLTPLGGEKAGNAAKTIPEWDGGITSPPKSYEGTGHHHVDPFPGDKPLFTITRSNLAQYKDNLSVGQIALFDAYPDTYSMPIYQTRRTASAPQWVYENTKKNAVTAELVEDGNGIAHAYGGIPFPIPKNGLEAIWNHITRYRGTYVARQYSAAAVQAGGAYSLSSSDYNVFFRFYDPKGSEETLDNKLVYLLTSTISPARLAGGSVLVHEPLNQVKEPRQAWVYAAGQRRVRRAPNIAYDTPIESTDGLRVVDDADMFTGAPDRYNWNLIGKKEIYIPYNNYKVSADGTKYKDILSENHINPAFTRYELHRVWVVEAKLKEGMRHIYSKRTFYIDEDSWQIALADQYDGRGDLWRVSIAYLKNFYELPTIWAAVEANYDLQSRRYYVTLLDSEEKEVADFSKPIPEDKFFSPSSLRARGVR